MIHIDSHYRDFSSLFLPILIIRAQQYRCWAWLKAPFCFVCTLTVGRWIFTKATVFKTTVWTGLKRHRQRPCFCMWGALLETVSCSKARMLLLSLRPAGENKKNGPQNLLKPKSTKTQKWTMQWQYHPVPFHTQQNFRDNQNDSMHVTTCLGILSGRPSMRSAWHGSSTSHDRNRQLTNLEWLWGLKGSERIKKHKDSRGRQGWFGMFLSFCLYSMVIWFRFLPERDRVRGSHFNQIFMMSN